MNRAPSRLLLGVSCCLRENDGAEPVHGVIDRYLRAPARHGDCDVVLVPALPGLTDWTAMAARLDGLLLTGSPSNVEPWRYGTPGEGPLGDGPFDPARDTTTLALAEAMLRAGKPVFGICRGFRNSTSPLAAPCACSQPMDRFPTMRPTGSASKPCSRPATRSRSTPMASWPARSARRR
jgi:hypothetical protein